MPSVTIDGNESAFEEGESVIQVATRNNIEIPYYCWHPRLSVAANCRMCLVEVEKAPKLLPACQTDCRDGMVVHTSNEKARAAQRAVHEFLLINHPIDCPICDQAGECKLQDYYMKFQLASSRMNERKVHKPRLERLGPYVIFNGERCIVCTRCIRFMEEVAGERQLGVFNRGDHAYIGTFPGQPLDSQYSLNTVDVCPVGALTSDVFRFKQRVWFLSRTPSLCGGCARGCNVHVDHRSGQVYRLLPRENDDVNRSWLCDDGRLTYKNANERQLTQPLFMGEQGVREVNADFAVAKAAELLQAPAQSRSGVGVAMSSLATCEEAYVLGRLVKQAFGVEQVSILEREAWRGDDILRVDDRHPNSRGITRVLEGLGLRVGSSDELIGAIEGGSVKALLCIGHESEQLARLAEAAQSLEVVIHMAHAHSEMSERAHVTLPSQPWVELDGTWVNVDNRAQRLFPAYEPKGVSRPSHGWLLELGEHLGVSFDQRSSQSIRAQIDSELDTFGEVRLCDVGPQGAHVG